MTAKVTSVSMGCSLVLALALLSRGVAQANLVENGGFETGDFSGWEVTSDTAHGGCQRVGSDVTVCGAVDLDPGPHGGGFAAYLGQPSCDVSEITSHPPKSPVSNPPFSTRFAWAAPRDDSASASIKLHPVDTLVALAVIALTRS